MVRYAYPKKRYRLAQRADGSCVFLNEAGLCRIHTDLGYEAKPTICRVFPLQLIPRDGNVALTIRRACRSSAADNGSQLKEHLPLVQHLVREGRLTTKRIDPPSLMVGLSSIAFAGWSQHFLSACCYFVGRHLDVNQRPTT